MSFEPQKFFIGIGYCVLNRGTPLRWGSVTFMVERGGFEPPTFGLCDAKGSSGSGSHPSFAKRC
jgi:hypothetical protein